MKLPDLKRFDVILPSALVFGWLALTSFGAGGYLDEVLFFHPFLKAREAFHLGPTLDPRLRLILVDDKTLEKLHRHPTFADWQKIAQLLSKKGVERVILPAFPRLPQEVGDVTASPSNVAFVLGALVHQDPKNPRGTPTELLPPDFLLDVPPAESGAFEPAPLVIAPSPDLNQKFTALATINLSRNDAVPTGYVTSNGRLLPFLGLESVAGLHWDTRRAWFANDLGNLPKPQNGLYFIDVLSESAAIAGAVPAAAFFDAQGAVVPELKPALAERMQGAKVAAFVPDAFSGGRFIDSPIGKMPSYLALIATLNSTLNHRYVFVPLAHFLLVLLTLPFLSFLLQIKRTRLAQLATGIFLLGVIGTSVVGLQKIGWFLPCAQIVVLGILGALLREGRELIVTFADKISLAKDLEMGQTVQNLLLPETRIGRYDHWDYGVAFQPYGPMSGDWFQIFTPPVVGPSVSAMVAIGDVVGKGPSAALTTATVAGSWQHHAARWAEKSGDIPEFALDLNDVLTRAFRGVQNSTLCIAALSGTQATIATLAAPKWVHVGPGRDASVLVTKASDALGMILNGVVPTKAVTVEPGEVLIAYTDGVIEGGAARKTFFDGLDAIKDWNQEFDRLFGHIEGLARSAGKDSVLPDDFTLLVIRSSASPF